MSSSGSDYHNLSLVTKSYKKAMFVHNNKIHVVVFLTVRNCHTQNFTLKEKRKMIAISLIIRYVYNDPKLLKPEILLGTTYKVVSTRYVVIGERLIKQNDYSSHLSLVPSLYFLYMC